MNVKHELLSPQSLPIRAANCWLRPETINRFAFSMQRRWRRYERCEGIVIWFGRSPLIPKVIGLFRLATMDRWSFGIVKSPSKSKRNRWHSGARLCLLSAARLRTGCGWIRQRGTHHGPQQPRSTQPALWLRWPTGGGLPRRHADVGGGRS